MPTSSNTVLEIPTPLPAYEHSHRTHEKLQMLLFEGIALTVMLQLQEEKVRR